jgi:hypothetical protein
MTTSINLRPDEQIVFQVHGKRAWYNIVGTILVTGFVFFFIAVGAGMLMQTYRGAECYTWLILALILFSGISDVVSRLISEVTLTNRRIIVKGVPNPWTHYEVSLEDVQRLTTTLGGIRIKQKNRWLSKAVAMANKWEFINAYNDLIRQGGNSKSAAHVQRASGVTTSKNRPTTLPPAAPPASVHPKEIPIPARGSMQTSPATAPQKSIWAMIIFPVLVIGIFVGLMYAGKSLIAVPKLIQVPSPTPNYEATRQARNVEATATAQFAWVDSFAKPILSAMDSHAPNFKDDFSTTRGRFVRWSSMTTGVSFTEGVMRMKGENWTGAGGSLVATDFAISFDVTPRVIGSGSSFAVTFRSGNDQWYDFHCNLNDDWCGMMAFLEGQEGFVISGDMSGTDPRQRRNILVIAKGNEFAFYIDERPFVYVRDNRLHGERIDIGLWSSPGSSEIDFDNVKFWDLNNLKP